MSQTTRCPACQTRFKVVADQLRISDGWVRCGNCKQVFDASLALEPAVPEPLLPDMLLDELRGPVARATPQAPASGVWGAATARSTPVPSALPSEPEGEPDESDDGFAHTQPGDLHGLTNGAANKALIHAPSHVQTPAPHDSEFVSSHSFDPGISLAASHAGERVPPSAQSPWPSTEAHSAARRTNEQHAPTPGGYELPAAQIEDIDSDWPDLFEEPLAAHSKREASFSSDKGDAAELDLAHFIAEISDAPVTLSGNAAFEFEPEPEPEPEPERDTLRRGAPAAEPPGALDQAEDGALQTEEEPDWSLVEDGSDTHAALFPPDTRDLQSSVDSQEAPEALAALVEDETEQAQIELSFVRSARRRAFWTSTGVRLGLALVAIVLLMGLFAQVAFRERARLAVAWPQSRSLLEAVCTHLGCSVGMYRDIGAVLVEGSAFNRVQGDRYQFSLSLRNRTALPVEAPAIELTLTDAEDQPVLRRILLPADLAVPSPLRPGQEWSTVAPMTLGQGGLRVAGYRVVAFYP